MLSRAKTDLPTETERVAEATIGCAIEVHRRLIVEHRVIVELKAVERLDRIHQAQLISYLRASRLRLGLLMNFNTEQLRSALRRVVL